MNRQRRPRDYAALTPAQRIDALTRIQRAQAHLDAERVRLLASIEQHPADPTDVNDKHWDREEVACVLKVASVTAQLRMLEAVELVSRYPATLAKLDAGEITHLHALKLVEAGIDRSDEVMAQVEQWVLVRAAEQSVGQFKASVTRTLARIAPKTAEQQLADAHAERRVVFMPQPSGTTDVYAEGLPAADAAAMQARIREIAKGWKGLDERTAKQREADALVALVLGNGDPDKAHITPTVSVVVAVSTLLGTDEQPGELDGTPVPASVARALAFDPSGTWRRLLTDADNHLVDVSADTYTPPVNMERLVKHRQTRCSFRGCRRRATNCETDHIIRWVDGGPTCPANLQPLCARHHHLKDESGWRVHRRTDLTTDWTSPTGHHYARPPDDDLPRDGTRDPGAG